MIFSCRLTEWHEKIQINLLNATIPRSKTYDRKRPVPWYSGDFMEAVFQWTDPVTGFIRFRSELTGTCQNWQPDTVTGLLCRIPGTSGWFPTWNGEFPEGFHRKFTEYCFRNHRPGYRCISREILQPVNLQVSNYNISNFQAWNTEFCSKLADSITKGFQIRDLVARHEFQNSN
jgi:hypothetical protein